MEPAYIRLYKNGELEKRANQAFSILRDCSLCPRECMVDRLAGEKGVCKTGSDILISSYGAHFGEEFPLVGRYGSGTIFLTNCNLGCVFCQNYDISHEGAGYEVATEDLAGIMIAIQKSKCHNINFVTPTHMVPQILAALILAIEQGLNTPLVYNSSGYDNLETIRLLDGIFDIYMPDFKFSDSDAGKRYAEAPDYFERASKAILEMFRQVGDLKLSSDGIAQKGLLIRHLVMPNNVAGTERILDFISRHLSKNTYINIMDQYHPCGLAFNYQEINRRITGQEYKNAIELAHQYGLRRLDDRKRYY